MKYRYSFIVEDIVENQEILFIKGTGTTKNKETCLKSIRREINQTIREMLTKSTEILS